MITNLLLTTPLFLGLLLTGLVRLAWQDGAGESTPPLPSEVAKVAEAAPVEDPPAPTAADAAKLLGGELLEKAARFQSREPRDEVPGTLYGAFYGTIRTPDGSGNVSVERWYTRSPERLLTRHAEAVTGSSQTIGWDGQQGWFRDDDSGEVVVYSEDPELFAVDLERLAEQRRLTRLLLDAIVLDALIPRLSEVRAGAVSTWSDLDGREHPIQQVHAEIPDELFPAPKLALPPGSEIPVRKLALDLAIDLETGALWRVGVEAVGRRDVSALELQFDFHGRTRSGLMVPGNVRVLRAGESEEIIKLGVDFDQDDNLVLQIDGEIDPGRFAPPAN